MGIAEFAEMARRRLRAFRPVEVAAERRAAVALCVVERDGALNVVVIRRAYRGRNAGQWALPGGRVEEGESAVAAAVRELGEEVGLRLTEDAVLGRLDDFPAASGFAITPIVAATADPGPFTPNHEVHAVHLVGLDRLAADDTPHWAPQPSGPPLLQMRLDPRTMVIHAPTGALLWQFREVVLLGRLDTRVADLAQPDWTRH
jgi:8-oxo-dGTP pyrophosphatase MutT (NUDIX family)